MECGREFFEALGNPDVTGGEVKAKASLTPEADGSWRLEITVKGMIETPCDRCLGPMQLPIADSFEAMVRPGLPSEMEGDDIAVAPGETAIDLTRPIADTIVLSIPLRHVHEEGECDPAMLDALNNRQNHPQSAGNPFEILAGMLNDEDDQ